MLGREPMNPRDGQFGLAGGAASWVRWDEVPPRQAATLIRAYRGWEPRTYGRLGVRQWRAPLPTSRLIIKDPFALLSLAAVVSVTGALPVVVFRTPAATLASYRRMGWRADLEETASLGATVPPAAAADDAVAMGFFWDWAYRRALADLARVPDAVVVAHSELTTGGDTALRRLGEAVGLSAVVTPGTSRMPASPRPPGASPDVQRLHNFERTPGEVMSGWRERVSPAEVALLDEMTAEVQAGLDERRLVLTS